MIGESEVTGGHAEWAVESALTEVANILVSHVASAIADTLGERLLPGLPMLVGENCDEELLRVAAGRNGEDVLRIECELSDRECELGGLLVLVPDQARRGRPPSREG